MNQDKLFVGIDVSSKNNVCYLMQSDGSKHSSFSVPNNRNGAKIIVDRVTSVLLLQDIPQVVIGMEATSVYGDNLMRFLRESGSLGHFDRHLYMLNPKQVKKFHNVLSAHQKFPERIRHAPLEENDLVRLSEDLQQFKILHVSGTDLYDIDIFKQ